MQLLVVGANGLLGSSLVAAGRRRGWSVAGTYHSTPPDVDLPLSRFDLAEAVRDAAAADAMLDRHDPDVVVNCAAMTDVDACEDDPGRAHRLNGEAPGALAARCERRGVDVVHVSTDYVFSGERREPYSESDEPAPAQVYGESKLAGERAVRAASDGGLVARLSFLYGVHAWSGRLTGFPAWVRSRLEAGDPVPLFTDQWVTPTRAGHAAAALLDLVERGRVGRYHVACSSCVSPYEFGAALADRLGYGTDALVEASTDDVERAATRPAYTCLDTGKLASALGASPPALRDDLRALTTAL